MRALGLALAVALAATPTAAQSPGPDAQGEATAQGINLPMAVQLVRTLDPRFAELMNFEALRQEAASDLRLIDRTLTSSYLRVLGPALGEFPGAVVRLRQPTGSLIEVNLVDGCDEVKLSDTELPIEDPCAWRHTWVYLVEPDGTVTTVIDVGDPDPEASSAPS